MAREVTPPSSPGFSLRDGWSPESPVDHSIPIHRPSLEPPDHPRVKDSGGHRDHDSDESNPGWQSPLPGLKNLNTKQCHLMIPLIIAMRMMIIVMKMARMEMILQTYNHGNPWNTYLNLLKEKDEFVSKSEARNSYAKLKNDMGGSDTEAWAAETECLTSELCGRKTAVGKKKGESGGDVVKLMEQTQHRWNADGKTLLNTGIHTFYMMVSDMASSSAAHSQNTSSMNSPQMESWYKSHFDPTQHIGDVYKYILAQQLRLKEVEALEEGESHRWCIMETQDMHHTKAACAQRMHKLLGPYMLAKVKVTKWMEIPKLLRLNQLQLEGLPTVDEFPLLGSWTADKYQTSHWNKMYKAFTHPEDHRICLEELPESPLNSDESMLPVMIDHHGRVQHTIGSVDHARASNNWSGGAMLGGEGINSPVLDEVREENVESTMGKRKYSELGRSWDSTGIGPDHVAEDAGEHDSDVEEDERPANQSPPPFLVTTSASSHVGATVPLVNSWVAQLRRIPTYLMNSGASTPLDNFPMSMSPPIQVLRDSSASSSSTPNSGPDMMSTHPNGPSQASFSLPSARVHLSAADFDALQMSFATWAGNGAGLLFLVRFKDLPFKCASSPSWAQGSHKWAQVGHSWAQRLCHNQLTENWSDMVSPFMVSGSWSPEKSVLLIPMQGIYLPSPRLLPMGWPNAVPMKPMGNSWKFGERNEDVYTAVFESDLRDVDSAMAGALVPVLGPSSISLCDTVPLPPRPPSPPPSPSHPDDMDVEPAVDAPITSAVDIPLTSAVDAPVTSAVDAPALTTDLIHYFGFEGKEGYSSEEPSDDDFVKKCWHQSVKDWCLEEAQRDPRWPAVTTDFPMAFLGIPEHYVLERWSSAPPGPPGYPKCAKKHHCLVNADQGPIDRPKSAWHEAKYGPSRGWSWSCSPIWGEEYLESERNCAEHNRVERDCVEHNHAFAFHGNLPEKFSHHSSSSAKCQVASIQKNSTHCKLNTGPQDNIALMVLAATSGNVTRTSQSLDYIITKIPPDHCVAGQLLKLNPKQASMVAHSASDIGIS
ncbi:hypothetical protein BS47DRAFT_1407607 [Hydnum rufescens UP504]|uniref:Uncharacterized protein n=1 Tax=Hydnum rufescens UP504 TaxID=1448309 RepID=A0A9P6ARF9_9AGAM|nr:hypothetical protein BS47DRAFT_1407607 [Hydnum rufescens UP504]